MQQWDIWTERATSSYKGRGPGPARGYEHHEVTFGRKPTLRADVAFENYGPTRYKIEASGGAKATSTFTYADGLVVRSAWRSGAWRGSADDNGDVVEFAIPLQVPAGTPVVPSFIARWLGVGTTDEDGVVARYVAVPEDGWGGYRAARKQWFPVMNTHPLTECEVAVGALEVVAFGRTDKRVRPLVHTDGAGHEVARLLVEPDSGAPLRYEQRGCVLTVVDEAKARSRTPKS